MKYDFFVASRWRNKDTVLELAKKTREKGKNMYTFIETDGEEYELRKYEKSLEPDKFMQHFESRNWQTDKAVREVFHVDLSAMKEAKAVILLLPAGKSAHIEIGIAYGLGKECILIGEQKEAESSYCIFEKVFPTIDDFIASL